MAITLYHGTCECRGQSILKGGVIEHHLPYNYEAPLLPVEGQSTAVYTTNCSHMAVVYALAASHEGCHPSIIVFSDEGCWEDDEVGVVWHYSCRLGDHCSSLKREQDVQIGGGSRLVILTEEQNQPPLGPPEWLPEEAATEEDCEKILGGRNKYEGDRLEIASWLLEGYNPLLATVLYEWASRLYSQGPLDTPFEHTEWRGHFLKLPFREFFIGIRDYGAGDWRTRIGYLRKVAGDGLKIEYYGQDPEVQADSFRHFLKESGVPVFKTAGGNYWLSLHPYLWRGMTSRILSWLFS